MTAMWGGGGRYEDWASFLGRWGAGEQLDPSTLPPLAQADFTGESWERLAARLTDALSRRLRAWADTLTRGIAEARDEFGAARALANARGGLGPIRALAGHGGLPADLAGRLVEAVDGQVRSAQESLEEQVRRMRRGGVTRDAVEARLRTIRDNPLTAASRQPPPSEPAGRTDAWYIDPSVPARRRVMVNPSSTPN
jgi:hypothetical protein